MAAQAVQSLLVWGGVDSAGGLFLNPAFAVDAPPALPRTNDGAARISGATGEGAALFSLAFDMTELTDGEGGSYFAFVLPFQTGWDDLASITLDGPGGSVSLDRETDLPMTILRDSRTGEVRAMLMGTPDTALSRASAADAALSGPAIEVLFSRGIPGTGVSRK